MSGAEIGFEKVLLVAIWIGLWCLCFVWPTATLGRKKQGNGMLWGWLGFFFGLFALIVAILMPYDPAHRPDARFIQDRGEPRRLS